MESETRVAFCLSKERDGASSVDWYFSDKVAHQDYWDAVIAHSAGDIITLFAVEVSADSTTDQVTNRVDQEMWGRGHCYQHPIHKLDTTPPITSNKVQA